MSAKTFHIEDSYQIGGSFKIDIYYCATIEIEIDHDYGADADGNRGKTQASWSVSDLVIECKDHLGLNDWDLPEEESEYIDEEIALKADKEVEKFLEEVA